MYERKHFFKKVTLDPGNDSYPTYMRRSPDNGGNTGIVHVREP